MDIEHGRRSVRLPGWNYAGTGRYFVTLCTKDREPLFGMIQDSKMILNQYGYLIRRAWMETKRIRPHIYLDAFQIMPDHVHFIVYIKPAKNAPVGAHCSAPLPEPRPQRSSRSLSSFIAQFKSITTTRIRRLRKNETVVVWQRNYWETIVFPENRDIQQIREYIRDNPANWQRDPDYIPTSDLSPPRITPP